MEEVWKSLDGIVKFGEFYEISTLGRVKSLRKNKIMKLQVNNGGYVMVDFRNNGERIHYTVHKLVAKAFIPNPNNLPEINHKDENRKNNEWTNLEWCDRKYNVNYGSCIENRVMSMRNDVVVFDYETGEYVDTFINCSKISKEHGILQTGISKILNGNGGVKKAFSKKDNKWYTFRYLSEFEELNIPSNLYDVEMKIENNKPGPQNRSIVVYDFESGDFVDILEGTQRVAIMYGTNCGTVSRICNERPNYKHIEYNGKLYTFRYIKTFKHGNYPKNINNQE